MNPYERNNGEPIHKVIINQHFILKQWQQGLQTNKQKHFILIQWQWDKQTQTKHHRSEKWSQNVRICDVNRTRVQVTITCNVTIFISSSNAHNLYIYRLQVWVISQKQFHNVDFIINLSSTHAMYIDCEKFWYALSIIFVIPPNF